MEVWSMGKLREVSERHVDELNIKDVQRLCPIAMITNILGLDASANIIITARLK